MLVLNRKKGESIIISDDIVVQIIDIQGDNIKLGIDAPREVSVLRKELYDEIIKANQEASQNFTELKDVMKKVNQFSKIKREDTKGN